MFNVQEIRKDFPILAQKVNGKPLVYLDNAATSQKPQAVIDAVSQYYREYNANIHRGVHTLAEKATAAYERSREDVAGFIGAARPQEVVFTSGSTGGLNLIAHSWGRANLKSGDTVLLTVMEHHSNIVPWQMLSQELGFNLEFIHVTEEGYLEDPEEAIRRIKPKLLSFAHVSNVLGTVNLVKKLCKVAHEVNSIVVVDGAQAVPHLPVDVQSLGADFYVFSGHKMLGPTGIGVLYGKKDLLEKMPPFMGGGEMIKEVYLRESTYKEPPYKFEAGTPHISGAIGLGAAVNYLSKLGMEAVRKHEQDLTSYALEKLSSVSGIKILGPLNPQDRSGVVAFTLEGIHPHDLATVLDQEGVAIRSGSHCTMPLHNRFGLTATSRASFSVYNTHEDVDVLASAIVKAKETLVS